MSRAQIHGFMGIWLKMKTTLELPDELMREIKVRAAREDRRLKDLVAELLRDGLIARTGRTADRKQARVALPLVTCLHEAVDAEEITPDRASAILLEEEEAAASSRHRVAGR